MMNFQYHPYHMVTLSPWPLMLSFSLMLMMLGSLKFFSGNLYDLLILGLLSFILNLYQWWRDVVRESTYQGSHTNLVVYGLRFGMLLFILSEVMFFLSFFWTYFYMYLSPSIELGNFWPPKGLLVFNPYNIPLLNTLILLSSGVSITKAHYSILNMNNLMDNILEVFFTILLGLMFVFFQYMEYSESYFSMADSVYGSIFFLVTGFHGLHVIMGLIFIGISYIRLLNNHYSSIHHFGFEASSWYWHFVDVVWLFLYLFVYWFSY